jgi:restriction system protein
MLAEGRVQLLPGDSILCQRCQQSFKVNLPDQQTLYRPGRLPQKSATIREPESVDRGVRTTYEPAQAMKGSTPDEDLLDHGNSKTSSLPIGKIMLCVAGLLILGGMISLSLPAKKEAGHGPAKVATRTVGLGETVRLGYQGRPRDVWVDYKGSRFFVPNPTEASVTNITPQMTDQRGRFYEVQITEGDLQGKRVYVEEHDLDLGWKALALEAKEKSADVEGNAKPDDRVGLMRQLLPAVLVLTLGFLLLYWYLRAVIGLGEAEMGPEQLSALREAEARRQDYYAEQARQWVLKKQEEERPRRDQEWSRQIEIALSVIRQHAERLSVRRLQTRRIDPYGNTDNRSWHKEISYFYDSVIRSRLEDGRPTDHSLRVTLWSTRLSYSDIIIFVDDEVDAYDLRRQASKEDADSLTPTEFEAYCVKLLVESGWNARGTKGSGDQGIDIVATKRGKKAVFQCKKWSKSVGNKAVQEAHAGRSHESADLAFVVSNVDFTSSARELASTCAVHLIHYSELSSLDRFLKP